MGKTKRMKDTIQRRMRSSPQTSKLHRGRTGGEEDLEQSLEELVSSVDRTDDDAEPKTKKPLRMYTHPKQQPIQGRRGKSPEEKPGLPSEEINFPRQRKKTMTTCIVVEIGMRSLEHSSIRKRSRRIPSNHSSPDITRCLRQQIGKDSTGRIRHPG